MLYWGIHRGKSWKSKEKLLSGAVAGVIILTSVLGLANFIIDKTL